MPYSPEALSLFRAAIRTIRQAPRHIHSKMTYNIKEIFEVYKDVADAKKRVHLLQEGWHDVGVFRELMKADPSIIEELFKHYEPITEKIIKKEELIAETEAHILPHADVEAAAEQSESNKLDFNHN